MTVDNASEPDISPLPRFGEVLPRLKRALLRFAGAGVVPIVVFYVGYRLGGPLAGILAGMVAALVALAVQAWRLGRLDPIVLVPMAIIVAQGTIAAVAGSVELYLAAPAVEALIWGVVLIGSVVARRPLVPLITRELDIVPSRIADSLDLRRALELLTLLWGLASFAKAAIRLWLLATLPLEAFLIAVTLALLVVNAAMLAISVWLPFRMVRAAPSARTDGSASA
jgi:intracellular septation protein A